MLGMLMSSLGQMIFSTALPTLVGELGGAAQMSWVITIFMLTMTVGMPVYGKLGDQIGRKPLFLAAIVLFLVGSVVGALAQNMGMMILARGIQGLGGGGLMVLSQAIIADVKEISGHVVAIVEASREQSTALAEINVAVGTIDQGTQQNAAMVEETSAATQDLASKAEQLRQLLSTFRLGSAPAAKVREIRASRPPSVKAFPRPVRFATHGSSALAQVPQEGSWEEF